jgi:hypothetical protein
MLIPIFLYRLVPNRQILMQESMIMQQVARWGVLIVLGVWAATLSSALGCLLGAPRTLQALSRDRVLPRILGRGYGPPRNRVMPWCSLSRGACCYPTGGSEPMLAPVLTMFFLTSYGLINLSAGLEGLIDSPTWRPTFRVRPIVCLARRQHLPTDDAYDRCRCNRNCWRFHWHDLLLDETPQPRRTVGRYALWHPDAARTLCNRSPRETQGIRRTHVATQHPRA